MARSFDVVLMTHKGEDGDGGEFAHLEGFGCYMTLCGFCDVMGEVIINSDENTKPFCVECLNALEHTRKYTKAMICT